ncbi:hypothetical protein V1264_019064 [Littorina saxatilis]|uniref:Uncharacterized protein n=1 Tax=Littorina saxatilis TaxID=31220 RepID=A0AAN9BEH8_9CAEN
MGQSNDFYALIVNNKKQNYDNIAAYVCCHCGHVRDNGPWCTVLSSGRSMATDIRKRHKNHPLPKGLPTRSPVSQV